MLLLLLLLFFFFVFFCNFVGTNVNEHGRLAKQRQVWSKSRLREKADNSEMVVLPNAFRNTQEESLKILSESK